MIIISSVLRKLAARFGYRIDKIRYQRYGIDPIMDVKRMAETFGVEINRCFDIGANIGQTAAEFHAAFPAAEILCFEPIPATYAQLQTNIAAMATVRGFNIALSDRVGEAVMHTYDSTFLASLEADALFTQGRDDAVTQAVRTDTLDRFCAEQDIMSIDLLKIDTEGHDISVLRGAVDMLSSTSVTFVLTEFNQLADPDGADMGSLLAINALLTAHGYSFIASYIDNIFVRDRPLVVGNALFVSNRAANGVTL